MSDFLKKFYQAQIKLEFEEIHEARTLLQEAMDLVTSDEEIEKVLVFSEQIRNKSDEEEISVGEITTLVSEDNIKQMVEDKVAFEVDD